MAVKKPLIKKRQNRYLQELAFLLKNAEVHDLFNHTPQHLFYKTLLCNFQILTLHKTNQSPTESAPEYWGL